MSFQETFEAYARSLQRIKPDGTYSEALYDALQALEFSHLYFPARQKGDGRDEVEANIKKIRKKYDDDRDEANKPSVSAEQQLIAVSQSGTNEVSPSEAIKYVNLIRDERSESHQGVDSSDILPDSTLR